MAIKTVDRELCNGCGICVSICPLDVIRLDTVAADREEYPPCRLACPAGVDMRGYFYLLRNGMGREAVELLREALPFPAITGRVCPHPCESDCARKEVDEAVSINALERFVADGFLNERATPVPPIYAGRVAVVGSGPAGLACAYFLCRMGYPVTVFEARPVLGGMLRLGIPGFRLPRDVLDAQLGYIRDLGVEFRTGVSIGANVTLDELRRDYQAVFFAPGSQLSRRLEVDGAALDGVLWGLEFLAAVNLGDTPQVKGEVLVIGGGNVAMDVALTAARLGAAGVRVACLESEEIMPAFRAEIEQAREEGVTILESCGPRRILGAGGRVTAVELVRCHSVYDGRGRFCPAYDDSVIETIAADTVILAIGQTADLSALPPEAAVDGDGAVRVDAVTLQTGVPGVFAGGDVVTGPASVVDAVAAGRRAADSIDRYLKHQDLKAGRYARPRRVRNTPLAGIDPMPRNLVTVLPVGERSSGFSEIKATFDEDTAGLEVQRCMTCGSRATIDYVEDCMLCYFCEQDCPQKAIYVSPDKTAMPLMPWR